VREDTHNDGSGRKRRQQSRGAEDRPLAAVVHELKGPMQVMGNLLYLLQQNPKLDEAAQRCVNAAEHELQRMRHIVSETLAVFRPVSNTEEVVVADVLEEVLAFYDHKIQFKGTLIERRFEHRGTIKAAPGAVRQLFSNLVVNSLEALAKGRGRLILRVRTSTMWKKPQEVGVRIIIADNGPGISPDQRSMIFEPFHTTKDGKGSGIGLWVSRAIVQRHGGFVKMRSSVVSGRHGTVFAIFLPQERPAERQNSS